MEKIKKTKRKNRYCLFLLCCSLLCGCQKKPALEMPQGDLKTQGIANEETKEESERESHAKAVDSESVSEIEKGLHAQKDGIVEDEWLALVDEQLALLPQNIQQAFLKDGWDIYVTDADINLTYYNGKFVKVLGNTIYSEGIILIEDTAEAVSNAPIHEIGHWLDFHNQYVSDSQEFDEIYQSECSAFIDGFSVTSVRNKKELFAEGFWQYIINPQTLEMTTPQLYWFIKNVAKNT